MARKRKPKAPQWVKVDGLGWVKAKVTVCRPHAARGVHTPPAPRVDMARRGEVHVTRINPTGLPVFSFGVK